MARRYELGMSLGYVSNWSIPQAVREILQNCYDEETVNPDNKSFVIYDSESGILQIGNKFSSLSTSTLLLGNSSKRDDEKTIGQHGEGYKVATIVLLRNNIGLRILNYANKEVWTAKVVNSKRYNAQIGVFDVDTLGFFTKKPHGDLIFELTGITPEIYADIVAHDLHLESDLGEVVEGSLGKCLKDDRFIGKVYVNGLYVCSKSSLKYGYDCVPSLIKLDRDRGLIDSFDLQYALGRLLVETRDLDFLNFIKEYWDGAYIRCFLDSNKALADGVYDDSFRKFVEKYGVDAFPTSDESSFTKFKKLGYNVALVPYSEHQLIIKSANYVEPVLESRSESIMKGFVSWFEKYDAEFSEESKAEFNELLSALDEYLKS